MAGDHFEFGGEFAWHPTPEYRERSRLKQFMARHALADFDTLLRRSIEDPDWFWPAVLDDLGIEFYEPYTRVLDTSRGPRLAALVRRRRPQHRPQLPRQVDRHAGRSQGRHSLGG